MLFAWSILIGVATLGTVAAIATLLEMLVFDKKACPKVAPLSAEDVDAEAGEGPGGGAQGSIPVSESRDGFVQRQEAPS